MRKGILFNSFFAYKVQRLKDNRFVCFVHPTDRDPRWQIEIDMSRSSAMAAKGQIEWSNVDVDAGDEDAPTKLYGWRADVDFTGIIYVADRIAAGRDLHLPPPGFEKRATRHEFQSVLVPPSPETPDAIQRFHGFHARITATDGHSGLVQIFNAGESHALNTAPATTRWLDFEKLAHDYDVRANGFTQIGPEAEAAREGAFFVSFATVKELGLKHVVPSSVLDTGKRPSGLSIDVLV